MQINVLREGGMQQYHASLGKDCAICSIDLADLRKEFTEIQFQFPLDFVVSDTNM